MRREIIGAATLYLGDCREWPGVGPFDVVITDPPYGVGLVEKTNDYRGSKHFSDGSLRASVAYRDDPEYVLTLVHEGLMPAIASAGRGLVFSGHRLMWDYPKPAAFGGVYCPNGSGRDSWGFGCLSPILYYGKCPYLARGMGGRPNSFSDNQPGERGIDHPCPKPESWMKWAVNRASHAGETILDPFMGSGTTGIAAVKAGRLFTGIELVPEYFDIACQRIEDAQRQQRMFG